MIGNGSILTSPVSYASLHKPVEPIKKSVATHFCWKNELLLKIFGFFLETILFLRIFFGQSIKQVFYFISFCFNLNSMFELKFHQSFLQVVLQIFDYLNDIFSFQLLAFPPVWLQPRVCSALPASTEWASAFISGVLRVILKLQVVLFWAL